MKELAKAIQWEVQYASAPLATSRLEFVRETFKTAGLIGWKNLFETVLRKAIWRQAADMVVPDFATPLWQEAA